MLCLPRTLVTESSSGQGATMFANPRLCILQFRKRALEAIFLLHSGRKHANRGGLLPPLKRDGGRLRLPAPSAWPYLFRSGIAAKLASGACLPICKIAEYVLPKSQLEGNLKCFLQSKADLWRLPSSTWFSAQEMFTKTTLNTSLPQAMEPSHAMANLAIF